MNEAVKAGINAAGDSWMRVFSDAQKRELSSLLDLSGQRFSDPADPELIRGNIAGARIVLSSWGSVPFTGDLLDACPDLELIVHAAGTVKPFLTDELLRRGIAVCSANHVNAIPVAEFTLGVILVSLKNVYSFSRSLKESGPGEWHRLRGSFRGGCYETSVGLVGYGDVARQLVRLLRNFEMRIMVADPFLSEEEAQRQGIRKASIEEVMRESDVVSLHAADIPETRRMIDARRLASMKPGATLINTARGRLVDEEALVAVLREGKINAVLDVTSPEPPEPGHPFFSLPNCILTPHIAGSMGNETHRMAAYCIREVKNWLEGKPFENRVDLDSRAFRA